MQIPQFLSHKVAAWRSAGYERDDHPAVAEILDWLSGRDAEICAVHADTMLNELFGISE